MFVEATILHADLDAFYASVEQLLGRAGEVWGAESGLDRIVVIRR